jgi:DNA-binding TFAR19-related protein (PDSD5 family)
MADNDLEAIRAARRQELQSQSGGGESGGQQEDEQRHVLPDTSSHFSRY